MLKNPLLRLFFLRLLPVGIVAAVLVAIYLRWPEVGAHLLLALAVAYPLCFLPFSICRFLTRHCGITANRISVGRIFVGLLAFPFFFEGHRWLPQIISFDFLGRHPVLKVSELVGLALVTASIALDRTDGRFATANAATRSEADKKLGKIIDPLSDKGTMLSMFAYLWRLRALIAGPGLLVLTFVEALSTLIRPPYIVEGSNPEGSSISPDFSKATSRGKLRIIFGVTSKVIRTSIQLIVSPYSAIENKTGPLDFLQPWLRTGKATWVGKLKMLVEIAVLLCVIPEHLYRVVMPWYLNPNFFIWGSAIFSALSIASRLRLSKTLDKINETVTKDAFGHEDL